MLENIALNTIYKHNLICKNDHIVVGVSGGADSISLLYFLNSIKEKFSLKITAVHINHCMRGEESDEDNLFVIEFCKKLNIPLKCFKFDIYNEAKKLSLSLEETGREFRYKTFNKVLIQENATKIAVAHNKDDNAETILMRFFRGTGLKGLCGISPKRDYIIRPLLNCPRKCIEEYCNINNIHFRNDSTNSMDIYTRNKIRLNLIPYLKENFNQNIVDTINNMSETFVKEETFLENMSKNYLQKVLILKDNKSIILNSENLLKLDEVLQRRIIRLSLSNFNKNLYNLSIEHINMIIALLKNSTGKSVSLPQNINVYKQYEKLIIQKGELNTAKDISYKYKLELDKKIFIKEINKNILITRKYLTDSFFSTKVCTISLNYDTIKDSLFLRQRQAGDKILLNGVNKKIKNLFIDSKIPAQERYLYPILLNKNEVISILGLYVSDNYKNDKLIKDAYIYFWEEI